MAHRTVSGAPGPYRCQPATLGKTEARSAIIHRTVRCATGLSGEPAEQRLSTRKVNSNRWIVSWQKSEQEVRVAPDCPVPQEDKAPMVESVLNPNSWVTWRCTGQGTVPVRWRTGLSGAPIARSLPNGYQSGWRYKYPPTTTTFSIQVFQRSHSIQELVYSLQDTFPKIKPSPSLEFNSNI
jgi:hypothetical protein